MDNVPKKYMLLSEGGPSTPDRQNQCIQVLHVMFLKNGLMYVYNRLIYVNNKLKQNQAILINLKINSTRKTRGDLG